MMVSMGDNYRPQYKQRFEKDGTPSLYGRYDTYGRYRGHDRPLFDDDVDYSCDYEGGCDYEESSGEYPEDYWHPQFDVIDDEGDDVVASLHPDLCASIRAGANAGAKHNAEPGAEPNAKHDISICETCGQSGTMIATIREALEISAGSLEDHVDFFSLIKSIIEGDTENCERLREKRKRAHESNTESKKSRIEEPSPPPTPLYRQEDGDEVDRQFRMRKGSLDSFYCTLCDPQCIYLMTQDRWVSHCKEYKLHESKKANIIAEKKLQGQ